MIGLSYFFYGHIMDTRARNKIHFYYRMIHGGEGENYFIQRRVWKWKLKSIDNSIYLLALETVTQDRLYTISELFW